jgi:hypothetical protein
MAEAHAGLGDADEWLCAGAVGEAWRFEDESPAVLLGTRNALDVLGDHHVGLIGAHGDGFARRDR